MLVLFKGPKRLPDWAVKLGMTTKRYRDLVARIDCLDRIEELSLLVHSPNDEGLLAMMVVAYNDESGDTRSYAVSGLIGALPTFVELSRLWQSKLDEYGLKEFHAAKCENRLPPFENYNRDERDLFQREFYSLIANSAVWGVCTAIWQSAYDQRRPAFEQHRVKPEGDFTHPYFLAFQHNIEKMSLKMDEGGFSPNERIAFVFDQHQELGGRAKLLYDSLSGDVRTAHRHRLGSLTFASRSKYLELQAADVWAYESRKYVSDVLIDEQPDEKRWQLELLRRGQRMSVFGFPESSLDKLLTWLEES